jgi:hypothetical protein
MVVAQCWLAQYGRLFLLPLHVVRYRVFMLLLAQELRLSKLIPDYVSCSVTLDLAIRAA